MKKHKPEAARGFLAERNSLRSLGVCAAAFKELKNTIQQEEGPVPSLDINYYIKSLKPWHRQKKVPFSPPTTFSSNDLMLLEKEENEEFCPPGTVAQRTTVYLSNLQPTNRLHSKSFWAQT